MQMEKSNSIEVVFEGWLTKSPPTRRLWRTRWRRRWFVLTYSGELPGQFVLTYYSDRNCRKVKGCIDLDRCEQVDSGLKLEDRKRKFEHVFDIKTPTRIYYLAADSEEEMKSWVGCICKVCCLKSTNDDEQCIVSENTSEKPTNQQLVPNNLMNSPNAALPVTTDPYIRISECITGKLPILDTKDCRSLMQLSPTNSFFKATSPQTNDMYDLVKTDYINCVNGDPRFYDSPRKLMPHKNDSDIEYLDFCPDLEDVFLEVQSAGPSDRHCKKNNVHSNEDLCQDSKNSVVVPPRPPKTLNINTPTSSNYLNLCSVEKELGEGRFQTLPKGVNDDWYDFPRLHQADSDSVHSLLSQRHCYHNAAPSNCADGQVFRYDTTPKNNRLMEQSRSTDLDDPSSPISHTSSTTTAYCNLPSPLMTLTDCQFMPPPIVHRELKPQRKLSDSMSVSSNQECSSPKITNAPSVDRTRKPNAMSQEPQLTKLPDLDSEPFKHSRSSSAHIPDRKFEMIQTHVLGECDFLKRRRGTSSSSTISMGRSHESLLTSNGQDQMYYQTPGKMQYLDLDLDCNFASNTQTLPLKAHTSATHNTVYKEVDFMKTQAFNITRNIVEKERKEPVPFSKK